MYLFYRRLLIAIPIIFTVILGSVISARSQGTPVPDTLAVIAAVPADFPPQYSLDDQGHPTGFAIDLMNEVAERANLQVTYLVLDDWEAATEALRGGRADLIPNNGITSDRLAEFDFTVPVETSALSIFVREATNSIHSAADLRGHRVAVVASNAAERLLRDREDIDLLIYPDIRHAMYELLAGHVDALVYPEPTLLMLTRSAGLEDRLKVVGEPLLEIKRGMTVRRGEADLLRRLNQAIEQLVGTADYEQIYGKWYGLPPPYWTTGRVAWLLGSLMALVVVGMGSWRYYSVLLINRRLLNSITERDRVEAALQESEIRFRRMVETMHEGIWLIDQAGQTTFVNPRMAEMMGYTAEEMIGRHLFSFLSTEQATSTEQNLRRRQQGVSGQREVEFIRKDGSPLHALLAASPIFGTDGCYLGAVAGVQDITRRKKAETRLAESESRYRNLVESAPEAIGIICNRRYVYVNPATLTMVGANSAEEIVGHNIEAFIHPEDQAKLTTYFSQPNANLPYWPIQFRGVRLNRQVFYVDGILMPITYNDQPAIQFMGRDVTEQRQLEAQYRQAQKMEAIGQLAGGIAHDFNNLLVPVLGHADLALRRLPPEHSLRTNMTQIMEAAQRAAALTRQILAFSRKQMLQLRSVDLNEIVDHMSQLLGRLIGEDIELRTGLYPDLWSIQADPTQIEQVILNLAVNARDAMPAGGNLTIETANMVLDDGYAARHLPVHAGPYVMLSVSDTGTGMSADLLEHIFEPFFTTKPLGEGSGLGLATVHGIVNQHGGTIDVYSEPDQGATFKIYLPQSTTTAIPLAAVVVSDQSAVGSETILVVEDDKLVHDLVCETLAAHGYHVLSALTVDEAQQLVSRAKQPIDLLLTDVIMPQLNGRALYQSLLADQPHLKVLYMSGYTAHAVVHQGILDEGICLLQKPFSVETLTSQVRQVLDEG